MELYDIKYQKRFEVVCTERGTVELNHVRQDIRDTVLLEFRVEDLRRLLLVATRKGVRP